MDGCSQEEDDFIPEAHEPEVEDSVTSMQEPTSTVHSQYQRKSAKKRARNVIEDHGTKAMAVLFGGKGTDSLASLRYNLFSKKIITAKSFVTPERLPPTESSTKYHCQRVYFQIVVWTGKEGDMNTVDWGWKLVDNRFLPVMTNKTAAPESLLL
ncbi:hypothetical protein G5714_004480 [Onychostoma macrolepis]|uniref:Uncharacterized protein n=1 Tax=Onychostoma macrolepis TaxID=369639 RepID=A0A7J6D4V3_9TELE|nr:hypothetical protein G5714_004480 [Onychostoma macrolepis]